MANSQRRQPETVISPERFGVSFSLKQCRDFKIEAAKTLQFLIKNMGFRRFRLMSYWDEHERQAGQYDFAGLDAQFAQIEEAGGILTLCLGARQPRWPESHWPTWALKLSEQQRNAALHAYITKVVERYKNKPSLISWQLENEALNRGFGTNGDFNRRRLRSEYILVKRLDPTRPIIMSTSNTWGIPLRRPRPDCFGFTLYTVQHQNGHYKRSRLPAWWYQVRATVITALTGRQCFIHELQAEPWGQKAIWEMSAEDQAKSMSLEQLQLNIAEAIKTKLHPIDLWGGEWWYWQLLKYDNQALSLQIKKLLLETRD